MPGAVSYSILPPGIHSVKRELIKSAPLIYTNTLQFFYPQFRVSRKIMLDVEHLIGALFALLFRRNKPKFTHRV